MVMVFRFWGLLPPITAGGFGFASGTHAGEVLTYHPALMPALFEFMLLL